MDNASFAHREKRVRASPPSQQKRLTTFATITSIGRGPQRESNNKNQCIKDTKSTSSTMSLESDDDQSIQLCDMFDFESNQSEPEADSTSVSLSHQSYIEIPTGLSVPTGWKPQTMQNTSTTIDIFEDDEEFSSICWNNLETDSDSDSDSDSSSTSTSTSISTSTSSSACSYQLISSSPSLSLQESSSNRFDCEVLDDEIFGDIFKGREELLRQSKTKSAFGNQSRGTKNKKNSTAWKQNRDNSEMSVSFSRLESEVIDDALKSKSQSMILRDYDYKVDIQHDCEQPFETQTKDTYNEYSVPLDISKDNKVKKLRRFARTPYLADTDSDDEESICIDDSEPSLELLDFKDEEDIDVGDHEEDYEDGENERPKDILWGLVYSLGGMALVSAVGGIAKYFSKIMRKSGGDEDNLMQQVSEVAEWSVEFGHESATFSSSFGGSGAMTGSGAANITTATASASASASASGSGAFAVSSVGLSTSTSALGTSTAAAVAAEATAMAATQAAVVQGMAISAASTASGAVAGATTAAGFAVAGATYVTATTAIVATTATAGIVAVASGATTSYLPVFVASNATAIPAPTCPEIPVSTMSRIKISFARDSDSLASDLIEGNGEWSQLGSQILENYNDISGGCIELYQRSMINCSYDFSKYNEDTDVIDTYWTSYVACNSSCPVDDPLFGIDPYIIDPDIVGSDTVAWILKPVPDTSNPTAAPTTTPSVLPSTEQSEAPTRAPTSAPTGRPKTPISREDFLQSIRAESVKSSTRNVFGNHATAAPTKTNTSPSIIPSAIPTAMVSSMPNDLPFPSSHPSYSPNNLPTMIPSSSPSIIRIDQPWTSPSDSLNQSPSNIPSSSQSIYPSAMPSFNLPIDGPSFDPSAVPNIIPSDEPSNRPSEHSSKQPSESPSYSPSSGLSDTASPFMSAVPTTMPTFPPTKPPKFFSPSPFDIS